MIIAKSKSNFSLLFVSFLFVLVTDGFPQTGQPLNFEQGLELYQQGQYARAAALFDQMDTPRSQLFAGKSYFGMGQYLRAKYLLDRISRSAAEEIYQEVVYTSALADFQLKQFDQALVKLQTLSRKKIKTQLITDSIQLYNDILNYLTLRQRKQAYQSVPSDTIKYDLIKSALGKVSYATARLLISEYKNTAPSEALSDKIRELEAMVSDSMNYAMQIAFGTQLKAPDGIIYNIGAALPEFRTRDQEFGISQGLYFGYLLAAEQFNRRNSDKKAFIRYKNTGADIDSSEYIMTDFAWNYQVDAVLGPLFSEPASKMAALAELYHIPMLAPLANSDTLNVDNPYVFQANPTFSSHGKKMAQFAVNTLQMDTLAVLAERNSLGEASAYAFRDQAEKLGAKVAYFFVEDLESKGYEITEYTKFFTPDSAKIDSLHYHRVDGIYAPFTGQAAPTLMDLLLVDLEAMNSQVTVLGSQEWGAASITDELLEGRNIYFSESYYVKNRSDRVEEFRQNFKERFGMEANRFAMIGYDAASYLLRTLERIKNPDLLKNALSRQPLYEGLISNIKFEGQHVNQEVKIFKLSDQGVLPAVY